MKILFFSNGNTAVFQDDQQVPRLQKPWLRLFIEFLEREGVIVEDFVAAKDFYITLPSGAQARLIPASDGWNWEIWKDGR